MRPFITKKTTHLREPITAEEKLAVNLRYLATWGSFNSLMYQYRIHRSTISQFIPDVCKAIYKVLAPDYMKIPSDKEEWQKIIDQTNSLAMQLLMENTSVSYAHLIADQSFTTTRVFIV